MQNFIVTLKNEPYYFKIATSRKLGRIVGGRTVKSEIESGETITSSKRHLQRQKAYGYEVIKIDVLNIFRVLSLQFS